LEPAVVVPLKDIEGRRCVIMITAIQTKEQEVLHEVLADPKIGMLGVTSRYAGRQSMALR
jgi:hypothetical protein